MASTSLKTFADLLKQAKNIIAITGAGVSAESGIPVFRGEGGWWKTYRSSQLATPEAFRANPGLVWEFYNYRREVAFSAKPNNAHVALASYENVCKSEGRSLNIITQNVDGLHQRAGSSNVLELHGALNKVICTKCKHIDINTDVPICEALRGRGNPKDNTPPPDIPLDDLPKCKRCRGLVRPYIVWFGESLDSMVMEAAQTLVEGCDMCLVIGTSSVVYPAAMFAPTVARMGKTVAEFNINDMAADDCFQFYFPGPCGTTIPQALGVVISDEK